ncbi:MAG: S41 family peptidase [Pseudomonadota bacterium]
MNIAAAKSPVQKLCAFLFSATLFLPSGAAFAAATPSDGEALRADLLQHYPSLAWVERYRQAYPAEAQGNDALWRGAHVPALETTGEIVDALAALQDQHIGLVGPKAGKQQTLGVLFRTSSDGAMHVWRHVDPAVSSVRLGDRVLEVNGQPVGRWLEQAGERTFGGNRRSRMAEAALKLGAATPAYHAAVGVAGKVRLTVRTGEGVTRTVELAYRPVNEQSFVALSQAVERADLPESMQVLGYRIGTVRFGAFAPQFDADFLAAAEAAEGPGATEDGPMLAGYCAVVRKRLARINALAEHADILLIDLRGNLGGFAREARLLARALTPRPLPRTYDVFRSGTPGSLKLVEQVEDPSCGSIATPRPLVVWTDAGTRSGGEFMASWLWATGAVVVGERTIGAGGGRDSAATGFLLPRSGLRVNYSGNFSVFDHQAAIKPGEIGESTLIDLISRDGFAPSRTHPFAIQAVGMRPDLALPTTADDLGDGGLAAVKRMMRELIQRKLLPPPRQ